LLQSVRRAAALTVRDREPAQLMKRRFQFRKWAIPHLRSVYRLARQMAAPDRAEP